MLHNKMNKKTLIKRVMQGKTLMQLNKVKVLLLFKINKHVSRYVPQENIQLHPRFISNQLITIPVYLVYYSHP